MNQARQPDLHLLQLSDCHLYADPDETLLGLNTRETLQRVLEDALDGNPAGMIILTGDLVHDGSRRGYQTLASTLQNQPCPSAVIPGNHDHLDNMREVMEAAGIPTGGIIDRGAWRLILLDSQAPGEEHGHLADEQLALLDQALISPPSNILIFLHHQPLPVGSRWLDNIGLDNGDALLSRVKDNPAVKGIAWGHVHQPWEGRLGHIQLLATPSTCVQFSPGQDEFGLDRAPPGWRRFTLGNDGRLSSEVHHLSRMPDGLIADSRGY